jgi:hypothetical protein
MEPFDSKRKPGPEHEFGNSLHHNEGAIPDAPEDTTTTQQEAIAPFPMVNTLDNRDFNHPKTQLTNGEIAMSVDFNPNGNPLVHALKMMFATTYDTLEDAANEAVAKVNELDVELSTRRKSSIRRWEAIAKTDLEKAQMAAVKAVTR